MSWWSDCFLWWIKPCAVSVGRSGLYLWWVRQHGTHVWEPAFEDVFRSIFFFVCLGKKRVAFLTLRPPVLSFSGVRWGSKIMWLVSMSMGDCLFPMAHRFQAECTRPQKDGTGGGREGESAATVISVCASIRSNCAERKWASLWGERRNEEFREIWIYIWLHWNLT